MLTTVILPPGVENPGSVLLAGMRFVVDPVDPVENSWRLKKEQQSYGFGTFSRKMGTQFEFGLEKMCQRGRELKITKSDQKWSRNGSPSIRFTHPRAQFFPRSGPELVG